jgi:lipoyl(octanoyl) transferase
MGAGSTLRVARLGTVDYRAALGLQDALVAAHLRDEIADTLLLLEHPHVFTLGRGADERFVVAPPAGVPVVRVSRGGQVTYHGPGQLVGYPILRLDSAARDVLRYLRNLEQVTIDALAPLGIAAERRPGLTGVWAGGRKLASIGVGIRRWVTCHGFAINVATDLAYFNAIVPCGIAGCEMTSVAALGRTDITVDAVASAIAKSFIGVFGYEAERAQEAAELWRIAGDAQAGAQTAAQA